MWFDTTSTSTLVSSVMWLFHNIFNGPFIFNRLFISTDLSFLPLALTDNYITIKRFRTHTRQPII